MKFFSWTKLPDRIKKIKGTDWLIVLLVGVLLLVVAIPTGSSRKEAAQETKETECDEKAKSSGETQEYDRYLETELEEILSAVEGVGKVKVMITLKNDGEKVLDKDVSTREDSAESTTVVYQYEEEEGPYVTSSRYPEVEGVLVVAQGGGNAVVCADILNAVQSLFSLEAHKITIVKMSVSEGEN